MDKLTGDEWKPKHEWLRCGSGEIVRSTLMDGHVYLQKKNGDIYRVWIGFDGIPLIECTEYNAVLPKEQQHKHSGLDTDYMTITSEEDINSLVKITFIGYGGGSGHGRSEVDPLGATPESIKAHEKRLRHIIKSSKTPE